MGKPNCAIIGFGRFGQLLASILTPDFNLSIVETDKSKTQLVTGLGLTLVELPAIAAAEIIFVCVPISDFKAVIQRLKEHVGPKHLIIDTCSVKVYPCEVMQKHITAASLLGSHPLFGPDSAQTGLSGLSLILCPLKINPDKLRFWTHYWQSKGIKVLQMTANEHDLQAAFSQGITHFIGRVLGELNLKQQPVLTKGYTELLQIVEQTNNDTWQLFSDLLRYNPYSRRMRLALTQALEEIGLKLDLAIDQQAAQWTAQSAVTEETLTQYRRQIDAVDQQIIGLLGQRFKLSRIIGLFKRSHGLKIQDHERETAIQSRLQALAARNSLDPRFTRHLYKHILLYSRDIQETDIKTIT